MMERRTLLLVVENRHGEVKTRWNIDTGTQTLLSVSDTRKFMFEENCEEKES